MSFFATLRDFTPKRTEFITVGCSLHFESAFKHRNTLVHHKMEAATIVCAFFVGKFPVLQP